MKLIKFNEYYDNNEKSFAEKMEDDIMYTDTILSNLSNYLSGHDIPSFKTFDELYDYLHDICYTNEFLDETDLPDGMDSLHDLCVYVSGDEKVNSTWDNLPNVMSDVALSGLRSLATKVVSKFHDTFSDFIENNKLDLTTLSITSTDPHGDSRPTKVIAIDDKSSVYQYRNLDGSYNVDVYAFEYENITLYLTKKL